MDKLTQVSIYDVMIFRNPAGDMMELQLHDFEGQRGLLRYSTAEEVARLDALAKQEAEEQRKRRNAPQQVEQLAIKIPAEAKQVEVTGKSIDFQVAAGRARGIVDRWRKEFVKAGWKEEAAELQGPAGVVSLAHDSQSLTLSYTDVGFMPAEISIDAIGIELVRARTSRTTSNRSYS